MRCGTRLTTWGRNTGSAQTWPTPCVAWPQTCGSARSSTSPTGWCRHTSRRRSSRRKAPGPVRLAGRNKSLQRGQTPLKSLRRRPMKSRTGAGLFIAVLVVGLAQGAATAPMAPPILVSGGFQTPESIFYEARSDVYLVSNINGDPTAADGNGFISRVAPDGRILELKWIDGTRAGVRLNGPKGMAVAGDTLYVSDITAVRMFDLRTGAPKGAVVILGSTFMNDLAAGRDGTIYATDTGVRPDFSPSGTDAVYKIDPSGKLSVVVKSPDLHAPNGITVLPDGTLVVVSFSPTGEVYTLGPGTKRKVWTLPSGNLDGVEMRTGGALLISSWGASAVFQLEGDSVQTIVSNVPSPADIGYDSKRDRVLIPIFMENRLGIQPVR